MTTLLILAAVMALILILTCWYCDAKSLRAAKLDADTWRSKHDALSIARDRITQALRARHAERMSRWFATLAVNEDTWEFYKDVRGDYRWQRTSPNNKVVGASTQGYSRKEDVIKNAVRHGFVEGVSNVR